MSGSGSGGSGAGAGAGAGGGGNGEPAGPGGGGHPRWNPDNLEVFPAQHDITLPPPGNDLIQEMGDLAPRSDVIDPAVAEGSCIRNHVYRIPRHLLTPAQLDTIQSDLTIIPIMNQYVRNKLSPFALESTIAKSTIKLYSLNPTSIVIPVAYGVRVFGVPADDTRFRGVPIPHVRFIGTMWTDGVGNFDQMPPLSAIWTHFAHNGYGCIAEIPPSAGKTPMFAATIAHVGRRASIVVPNLSLVGQWKSTIAALLPGASVGMLHGDKWQLDRDIVITTMQTLAVRDIKPAQMAGFGLAVFDELHTAAPTNTRDALLKCAQIRLLLGGTGTMSRSDGLDAMFEHVVGPSVYESEVRPRGAQYTDVLPMHFMGGLRQVEYKTVDDDDGDGDSGRDFDDFSFGGGSRRGSRAGSGSGALDWQRTIAVLERDRERNEMILCTLDRLMAAGRNTIVLLKSPEHGRVFTLEYRRRRAISRVLDPIARRLIMGAGGCAATARILDRVPIDFDERMYMSTADAAAAPVATGTSTVETKAMADYGDDCDNDDCDDSGSEITPATQPPLDFEEVDAIVDAWRDIRTVILDYLIEDPHSVESMTTHSLSAGAVKKRKAEAAREAPKMESETTRDTRPAKRARKTRAAAGVASPPPPPPEVIATEWPLEKHELVHMRSTFKLDQRNYVRDNVHRAIITSYQLTGLGVDYRYANTELDDGTSSKSSTAVQQTLSRFRFQSREQMLGGLRYLVLRIVDSHHKSFQTHWRVVERICRMTLKYRILAQELYGGDKCFMRERKSASGSPSKLTRYWRTQRMGRPRADGPVVDNAFHRKLGGYDADGHFVLGRRFVRSEEEFHCREAWDARPWLDLDIDPDADTIPMSRSRSGSRPKAKSKAKPKAKPKANPKAKAKAKPKAKVKDKSDEECKAKPKAKPKVKPKAKSTKCVGSGSGSGSGAGPDPGPDPASRKRKRSDFEGDDES